MKLREGNQNLQKVLKLKERLRHRNRKIMKKVKEKCSVELGELPSFEAEKTKKNNTVISSQRKQPRLEEEAKAAFCLTIKSLPKADLYA